MPVANFTAVIEVCVLSSTKGICLTVFPRHKNKIGYLFCFNEILKLKLIFKKSYIVQISGSKEEKTIRRFPALVKTSARITSKNSLRSK